MSQPPNTSWPRSANGTKSRIAGLRLSVRRPSRTVPICVSEPIGFASPFRIARMPAIVVVLTAPRPTNNMPSFPSAGAMVIPLVTAKNYIIRVPARGSPGPQIQRVSAQTREVPSAVDGNRVAGDPRGPWRHEVGDETGDLVRRARAAERMGRARVIEERRVLPFVHPAAPVQIRHDDARVDGVHANAQRREVERGRPGELIDGRL